MKNTHAVSLSDTIGSWKKQYPFSPNTNNGMNTKADSIKAKQLLV
ncbi:MAG: hypothetical protein SPF89_09950 [Sphaerochaetaceae bacterium]|nr:hypothetical protein [Spirochaetales bacterium]MDY5500414.1 hypothetical protein [Sphaerochaetaceae bacterium]